MTLPRARHAPLVALLVALVALLVLAQPAHAARGDQVIDDCAEDGVLDGDYSDEDLRDALRKIPADIDEYTECREIIERARRALRRGSGGDGGTGGFQGAGIDFGGPGFNDPITPFEEQALDEITGGDPPEVDLDGEPVRAGEPGGVFGQAAATANQLPLPLLLAMIATFLALALPTAMRAPLPEALHQVGALRERLSEWLSSLRRRGG